MKLVLHVEENVDKKKLRPPPSVNTFFFAGGNIEGGGLNLIRLVNKSLLGKKQIKYNAAG